MGVPVRWRGSARLIAVWPPNWTTISAELPLPPATPAFSFSRMSRRALLVEGFEVESVAGVEVGGNGLGVGVDHDRPLRPPSLRAQEAWTLQ